MDNTTTPTAAEIETVLALHDEDFATVFAYRDDRGRLSRHRHELAQTWSEERAEIAKLAAVDLGLALLWGVYAVERLRIVAQGGDVGWELYGRKRFDEDDRQPKIWWTWEVCHEHWARVGAVRAVPWMPEPGALLSDPEPTARGAN